MSPGSQRPAATARPAFSLIELLTVIFIISLLIAILLPSLNAARNQAKRASTAQLLRSLEVGLRAFKEDNGAEFGRTNGFPPSFVHPRIIGKNGNDVFTADDGANGLSPFHKDNPRIYGAHFLPMMLIGADAQGFIQRRSVPKERLDEPEQWYEPDPNSGDMIPRTSLYLNVADLTLVKTGELLGRAPENIYPDADWRSAIGEIPVIADSFDQAVLYYAANRSGSTRNMVERTHRADEKYGDGPPYYFHQDNEFFTGVPTGPGPKDFRPGWDFGSSGDHWIARAGEDLEYSKINLDENRRTFANHVFDFNAFSALKGPNQNNPLRPSNPDSFILISAGADGLYGTNDDVDNLPERQ